MAKANNTDCTNCENIDACRACRACCACRACDACDACDACRACCACRACRACRACYACDACYACCACRACRACRACYACDACYACRACCACRACDACRACYACDACYYSFGLKDCKAVFNSLFSKDLFGDKFKLFNKQVNEERYNEVWNKLRSFDFIPHQTNGFDLYVQVGSDWSKIDPKKLASVDWYDSWKKCPKEMVAYIASLPEFDAPLFNKITGLEAGQNNDAKQKAAELRKKADEILKSAEELEASL